MHYWLYVMWEVNNLYSSSNTSSALNGTREDTVLWIVSSLTLFPTLKVLITHLFIFLTYATFALLCSLMLGQLIFIIPGSFKCSFHSCFVHSTFFEFKIITTSKDFEYITIEHHVISTNHWKSCNLF